MQLEIGGRPIGLTHPVFVVAEIGLNHGGTRARALELVDAAAWAGASAIKLQTLQASELVAEQCPAPEHVRATSLRDFFARFELSIDDHRAVVARAREHGLGVLTTPFSERMIPALECLRLDAYKIASGDLTYDGLIGAVARTGRPIVLSTGMSDMNEVHRALEVALAEGARHIAVLHCVSAYPTPVDAQNLRAIATLTESTGLVAGLSDHGPGLVSAVIAATLGACLYERHLVLEGDQDAIDREVSSTPEQLKEIIRALADTRAALGDGVKQCMPAERANTVPSRRGLYATRRLRQGEPIKAGDVSVLRPATDVAPSAIAQLVGKVATREIAAGDPFVPADLAARRSA